jgi:hypothetical protein
MHYLQFLDASVRQANWDASKAREKLSGAIHSYIFFVHTEKLAEITTNSEVICCCLCTTTIKVFYFVCVWVHE